MRGIVVVSVISFCVRSLVVGQRWSPFGVSSSVACFRRPVFLRYIIISVLVPYLVGPFGERFRFGIVFA